jgi:hypothetical protein
MPMPPVGGKPPTSSGGVGVAVSSFDHNDVT